jgi:hypothetical protein
MKKLDIKIGGFQSGFVDGHAEFVTFNRIAPRSNNQPIYNQDWTLNGIAGFDVK